MIARKRLNLKNIEGSPPHLTRFQSRN